MATSAADVTTSVVKCESSEDAEHTLRLKLKKEKKKKLQWTEETIDNEGN